MFHLSLIHRQHGKPALFLVLAMVLWTISCFAAQGQVASQQIYLQCLTNFETYAETVWHPASYAGAPADSGYWGDGGAQAGNNGGIRGNGGIAVAYAVLCLAYPNDPRYVTRLSRVRQALNYNASTHFTGTNFSVNGYQWGWGSGALDTDCSTCNGCADWQSAEWAGSMGLACLLLQSNLPATTVAAVQRVIASEATHRAGIAPCSGYISDTKAEENAWDGNPIALAAAWMSNSNNAATWLGAAEAYLVNTYTLGVTAGDPLSNWVSTVTLYPDFSLENHGFYHPTYEMVAGMSSGDSLLMARLSGAGNIASQLQPFAEHNVLAVWTNNLSRMLMDSGEFAYPSGLDWDLHDYEQNSYITWMAAHFNDPVARWADGQLAQLVSYRQSVNSNGMFVGVSGGGFYREAVEARRTAIAWLQWAGADYSTGPTNAPAPVVSYFPDVGVIVQRSPWGFVSLSYKDTIMGMVESATAAIPGNTFVSTPTLPGVLGVGPLGKPTSATLLNFSTNASGFTAELLVQNGANGSTRIYVNSCGEAVGMVEVPLPASGVAGSMAGCFTNGIENDPLTGGIRLLEWAGGAATVTNFSGVVRNITNGWVCVAGRYGLASGPGAVFRYTAATGYNRPGAAQDYLAVMPQTLLAARYAVWFPNHNSSQTAALAGQITWTTNNATAVLTFPGNGNTNVITANLLSGNGTWAVDADGNWRDSSNWSGGNVADGAGAAADFSTVNLSADRTVTLDGAITIGALKFGDSAGTDNWVIDSTNNNTLTLSAALPSVVVSQNTATLNAPLAGTSGLVKSGGGTLVLSGSNSISGMLHIDSGSTSANDGAVRIIGNGVLANITALDERNNSGSGASSTLQLDGSAAGLIISQTMTNDCRNNSLPNVENLAGSNVFAGNLCMQTGGTNMVLQSDNGTLVFSGALQYVGALTSPRWFNFYGAGATVVAGPIVYSSVAPLYVGKYGPGRLVLNGTNTYTGETTVFAGTLAGNGTIAGPVNILPGAFLSPGDAAPGALTINNVLTNNGTLIIRLEKSDGMLTNDHINGISTLAGSGSLQLALSGDPITVGDSFKIFSAASSQATFSSISPPQPGTNLVWNSNELALNGTLSVALGAVAPRVGQYFFEGQNLVLRGDGGASGYGFSVLETTDLAMPFSEWSLANTGICDQAGEFVVTNPLVERNANLFYVVRIP